MNAGSKEKTSIVIAGDFRYNSTALGLANGFRSLGWSVREVALSRSSGQESKIERIVRRALRPFIVRRYNNDIISTVIASRPHLFLTVKGSFISPATLKVIAEDCVPAVNYFPDCRMSYPGFDESILCGYDRIFTTKSFHVDYLKDRLGPDKVQFLHHGYMTGVHAPPDLSAPLFNTDILYIGNHSLEKESWLFSVKRRFPRLRIKIFGNRWQNAHCSTILGESVTGGPVYGRDYAAAIHSAKINLGIHMGITDSSGWYDRVSTRTFEIPACKGFMLHVDNEEVRQLFVPGVEIDVFKNIEELFEKIEYYLVRDDIRREMVERAYNRCVPAYSYDARARVIADWLLSEKMAVQ